MAADVYFIRMSDSEPDELVCSRLESFIRSKKMFEFVQPRDTVAVKTHFGEEGTQGFVRPLYLKMLAGEIYHRGGLPFLTETSTLYRGKRTNAVEHIQHAYKHGFTPVNTGVPIIMADGLLGDEEVKIKVPGRIYNEVGIASLIAKANALVLVSHFTGHLLSGFGAALKNLGMGCASRKGKLVQHSTAKPVIKQKACTGCKECITWCPREAISLIDTGKAEINGKLCIGCGECLAVCRFDAVKYNWSETYTNLQQKVVEHAMGVMATKPGKAVFINFLNRISKDCDCMKGYEKIIPDIGILISYDPVAVDSASYDLFEKESGKKLANLSYNIPNQVQLTYSRELGFGSNSYNLIEVSG